MLIAELYDEYQDRLLNYARHLCRESALADDLVQETFVRAMANIELLSRIPGNKRQSWLFSVMKNCFIDIRRKQKFEKQVDENFEPVGDFQPESNIEAKEMVSSLPLRMKDVIFRKYWMGMNSSEIADELSVPPGTVRYWLHGALKKIREEM